jgi:hypothetical protein
MNETEMREVLSEYGYGFELIVFTKHDRLNAYPTRRPHIHKISLDLRRHVEQCNPEEVLKHLLTKSEFDDWSCKTKQLTLEAKKTS